MLRDIFRCFSGKPSSGLLNQALSLSLSPDSSWPAQVEKLLRENNPLCSENTAKQCSAESLEVKEYAISLLSASIKDSSVSQPKEQWVGSLISKFPWVNRENISKLYSQTQYQMYK